MRKSLLILLVIMTSCARYHAKPLENIPAENLVEVRDGLSVGYKKFNSLENKCYLDYDFCKSQIEVIQLTFANRTKNTYEFSSNRLSIPTYSTYDAIWRASYSPIWRFIGVTVGGTIAVTASGMLIIDPMVCIFLPPIFYASLAAGTIDAACAVHANNRLERDYQHKAPINCTIHPYTTSSTLFFVKQKNYQEPFSFFLVEEPSGELVEVNF